MGAELDSALRALLAESLPGLFGGQGPAVKVSVVRDATALDARSAEAVAGEPRPDDRLDAFAFDSAAPEGPYVLTAHPYPGPRRVRLRSPAGDLASLADDELAWDAMDTRKLRLELRPSRDVSPFTGLEVRYAVTAVFTSVKGLRTLDLALEAADASSLPRAEALALAVIALNRERLAADASTEYVDGDYRAQGSVLALRMTQAAGDEEGVRHLTLIAEVAFKLGRALRDDEGAPIEFIRTPGRPLDPARAVDVAIEIDA